MRNNEKPILKLIWDKIVNLYSKNIPAVIFTVIGVITISVLGVLLIRSLTADTVDAATPEVVTQLTTHEQSTTEVITTFEETTVEVTTQEETSTEEITTPPPTTVSETIPIEQLTVSKELLEESDPKKDTIVETPTETPTKAPVEKPTAPPTINEIVKVVNGIDVSHWQGKIDWAKVKAAGIDFAIIRAGYRTTGSGQLGYDPRFKENIEGALANGIQVGVYFFSQAITVQEAKEEASLVLSIIKDYKITYPVAFNWEGQAASFRATQANLSRTAMTQIIETFCSMVKSNGYTPMIYGNSSDLGKADIVSLGNKYKIWLARYFDKYKNTGIKYSAGDTLPSYNFPYQIWQYGSTGRVDGINGNVDLNVGFFTYSGSEVPTSPIKISLPNSKITTNINVPINLLDGVKATNTAGLDVTSSIKLTLKDGNGNEVSRDLAFMTPGSYTVSYYIKDFTGASKTVSAVLIVRGIPIINITSNKLIYPYEITIDNLKTVIAENFVSSNDYEGNNISNSLAIIYDDKLSSMIEENKITSGTYTITYTVIDNNSLSSSASLTLIIEEEITTETETFTDDTSTVEISTDETTTY